MSDIYSELSLDDVCALLKVRTSQDMRGSVVEDCDETLCFCEVKSITQTEFASMGKLGFNPHYKITLRHEMYNGEKLCRYNGHMYDIYRTYEANADYTELYLTLKEGLRNDDDR